MILALEKLVIHKQAVLVFTIVLAMVLGLMGCLKSVNSCRKSFINHL